MKKLILQIAVFHLLALVALASDPVIRHFKVPKYSALALGARVQGSVQLKTSIGSDGVITRVEKVSGHWLLIPNAVDAVKEWTFIPEGAPRDVIVTIDFVLRGEPVEHPVVTEISADFPNRVRIISLPAIGAGPNVTSRRPKQK